MMTNEVLHVGNRNKSQTISYLSVQLSFLKITRITHVEVIPGPNVLMDELVEIIETNSKFTHSVKVVKPLAATVYIILK